MKNSSSNVSHTYTSPGTFNVTLVVANPEFEATFSNKNITVDPILSVSQTSISFNEYGGSSNNQVFVTSLAGAFSVSGDGSWVTISSLTQDSFIVQCETNLRNPNSRSRTITVSNAETSIDIIVTQAGDPYVNFCPPGCRWDYNIHDCVKDSTGDLCMN